MSTIDVAAIVDARLPKGYVPHVRAMAIEIAQEVAAAVYAALASSASFTTDQRTKLASEMADRLMSWKLPDAFNPDGGISFKRESDYEHPEFGRTKYEPTGTNLFTHEQAVQMFLDLLPADAATPASAPVVEREALTDEQRLDWALWRIKDLEQKLSAALSSSPAPTEPSKPEQAEGPRWPNVETAMEDPLFQRARAIMGTDNWFQDNALRNVINYVLSQQNEAVSGNGESDPLTSDDVIHDASRASQESRHGKNQRDQHRGGKTGADRAHDQSTGRRDGIHGACDVSAKVDATPPASAAGERVVNCHVARIGFRFDGTRQQHIPDVLIEFEPVPVGAPNNAKGWEDRDAFVAALASTEQAAQQDREDAELYRLLRRGQHWSVIDGIGNTLRDDHLDASINAARAALARGEKG